MTKLLEKWCNAWVLRASGYRRFTFVQKLLNLPFGIFTDIEEIEEEKRELKIITDSYGRKWFRRLSH